MVDADTMGGVMESRWKKVIVFVLLLSVGFSGCSAIDNIYQEIKSGIEKKNLEDIGNANIECIAEKSLAIFHSPPLDGVYKAGRVQSIKNGKTFKAIIDWKGKYTDAVYFTEISVTLRLKNKNDFRFYVEVIRDNARIPPNQRSCNVTCEAE
jgi:hypothetical protein